MNTLTQNFSISNQAINMVDGLYSLNDCHKASGGLEKHRPTFFLRNDEANEMIAEIKTENARCADLHIKEPVRVVRGRRADKLPQGTYACKELVYRYAMWISPKFALTVIRAFDDLVTGKINPRPTTKDDRTPLKNAVNMLVGRTSNLLYSDVYKMVHQYMGVTSISQIDKADLPKAVEYVHGLVLKVAPSETVDFEYLQSMNKRGYQSVNENARLLRELEDVFYRAMHKIKRNNGMAHGSFESLIMQTPKQNMIA